MNALLIAVGLLGDDVLTDQLLSRIVEALLSLGVSTEEAEDVRRQLESIYGVIF